jgi:hypothetical protein
MSGVIMDADQTIAVALAQAVARSAFICRYAGTAASAQAHSGTRARPLSDRCTKRRGE